MGGRLLPGHSSIELGYITAFYERLEFSNLLIAQ
jgi:hypothetical protein